MIQTEGLTKRYGDVLAVNELNIQVCPGEIYGFLGPNGAGKTSTIMMLLGIEQPTDGRIFLFETPVTAARQIDLRRRIGVVSEVQHLYDDMTAYEYLSFFADIYGVERQHQRIMELLEAVELKAWHNTNVVNFSHGMQQKLGLVRALLHNPDLLILDEPVSGLDPHGIRQVRELIKLARDQGKTIFLSSHILSEVEKTADRIGIIHKGKLLIEGTMDALLRQLGQKMELEIELLELNEEMLLSVSNLPFVKQLHTNGNVMKVLLDTATDHRGAISEVIAFHGGIITGMKSQRMNLEEAFINITERQISLLASQE
jgi:ABC-type multidrug transport system ATPase subunit